ncbi:NADH-quinone oxidoreductase subunit C, partial [Mycolicibacterium porcinum]|uniref:NADH-quinone oxidoreductase subunit C n=1 Tax=Mycolicibacterium porcinum TaxID=39693 RepID=UPI003D9BAAF6
MPPIGVPITADSAGVARSGVVRFELCLGVSGVHYPDDTDRELHAVYPLMSITHNRRIRLEVAA